MSCQLNDIVLLHGVLHATHIQYSPSIRPPYNMDLDITCSPIFFIPWNFTKEL